MGRAKVKYELIEKERSRNTTFQKRKKGLKKKIYEFSTLCGVDACLIIYPMQGNRLNEADTWPEEREDVLHIIDRFRKNCTATEGRGNRHIGIPEFFEDQIKKLRRELTELRQQNSKTKYPTWDDRLNNLSVDQLKNLAQSLDSKIEYVKAMIDINEGNHYVLDDVAGLIEYSVPPLNQNPPLPLPLPPPPVYRDSYSRTTMDDNMQMQMMNHFHHQPYYALDSSLMIKGIDGMGNSYGTSSGNIPYHAPAMVAPISSQICYNSKFPTVDEMTMVNKPCYFPGPYYAQQLHQINDFPDLRGYHHDTQDEKRL